MGWMRSGTFQRNERVFTEGRKITRQMPEREDLLDSREGRSEDVHQLAGNRLIDLE